MKRWIYAVLLIGSVSLWAAEVKKIESKTMDVNQSLNSVKAFKKTSAASSESMLKKKKEYYPRGTIATH